MNELLRMLRRQCCRGIALQWCHNERDGVSSHRRFPHKGASNAENVSIWWRHHGPLKWRHNECVGVSNHQPHYCLFNRLFRSKKTSKLRVTGLCAGNSPVTGEFTVQRASTAENVSIWWRHHPIVCHDAVVWSEDLKINIWYILSLDGVSLCWNYPYWHLGCLHSWCHQTILSNTNTQTCTYARPQSIFTDTLYVLMNISTLVLSFSEDVVVTFYFFY